MNLIFQTVIIIYLFLMVPFHFGILETTIFKKRKKTLSEILINGFLLMLASFCVISVIAVKLHWVLTNLAKIWIVFVMAVSVLASVFGFKQIKIFAAEMLCYWNLQVEEKSMVKNRYKVLGILAVLLIIAVFFTRPSYEDATLEIVKTTIATNAMYCHDPYSGLISFTALEGHEYSPIEMLYAIGADITGMEVSYMLYYLIPICILIYFYMGIWCTGKHLLENEEKVLLFTFIVSGIYWMMTYVEGKSLVTGIFLNSWNGLTLLSCVVMPVAFGYCVKWMNEIHEGNSTSVLIEKIFRIVVLLLAGQLTNAKGGFYIGLMLFVTLAVISVRKGYDYVVTSGRFKKRV